ncbi:MAG: tyrosine-protein phosphatase [Candidatus Eiseniibacteriota bacterium]
MLDLHCHILPGVDDGAVDLADAFAMARAALATGCRAVCATSHLGEGLFDTSTALLATEHPKLVAALRQEKIGLEVFPGAENFLAEEMGAERFAENAVPLGSPGRYVLFDFSMREAPGNVLEAVEALSRRGRVAVIAHPERNRDVQVDPAPLADWIAAGALLQVNAGSVLGTLGDAAQSCAVELLEAGAAHVLASDAHGVERRRPFCLDRGRRAAAEIVGEEEAERLTSGRPWSIARGEDIRVEPVTLPRRGGPRTLWRRLFDG